MDNLSLLSAFLIGMAGSVHCFAMCGGIVAGLQVAIPKSHAQLPYIVSYNAGRILSYTIAGAIAGTLGTVLTLHVNSGVLILQLTSGLFLLALSAYIGQWWMGLTKLESLGKILWSRLAPVGKSLLPFKSPINAFPYGIIWGWLPCGLVYSTLAWSLASGSGLQGALTMTAFGVGTLPAVLLTAVGSRTIHKQLGNPKTRQLIAVILLLAAIYTLLNSLRLVSN